MFLHKTDKAHAEFKPGMRSLGQRERAILLLADGNRSFFDLRSLYEGEGEKIVRGLVQNGFLVPTPGGSIAVHAAKSTAYVEPPVSADNFEGKRSLATTRMFLFDLCERMFSRRDPSKANHFREALRGAKDRETMLAASREMLEEIERVAGSERADSISERLAMLLPLEPVA